MKENEKRVSFLVEEGTKKASNLLDNKKNNKELKKPIIFGLMGVVFSAVCTSYLNRQR
jgi:hypothetical protein